MVWGPQLPQEGWKPCQKCRRIRPRVLPCLPSEEAAVLPLPWLLGLPSEAPTTLCSTEGRQACLGKHPFTRSPACAQCLAQQREACDWADGTGCRARALGHGDQCAHRLEVQGCLGLPALAPGLYSGDAASWQG